MLAIFFSEKRPRKSKQISRARENPRVADLGDEPAGQNLNLDGECQYCFMRPCITARNLQIVGSGQSACEDNSGIRKGIYKLYWKVLNNAGLWNNPRYLAVKVQRANGREWAISHKREVMPICVLVQLRALYPNPKGKPYMDHMWN